MSPGPNLQQLLAAGVSTNPAGVAVEDPGAARVTYRELDLLSDALRDRLRHMGVQPGDRVGLYLHKSVDSIVSIFGILKCGAAYVPVDPDAPPSRCAYVLDNCSVRVIVTQADLKRPLAEELAALGDVPPMLVLEPSDDPLPIRAGLRSAQEADPASAVPTEQSAPDDLAYILYTSGSTGQPKGVQLTHRAARCFIDWCTGEFGPHREAVYSSHAPLHFDLSIHDVFVPLAHGARLVLISEQLGKDPLALARVIAEEGISVWYSTPSILNLLATHGKLERYDFSALRLVLFAGEVFPIPQLRAIKQLWPHPRYYNLYGPTETNVCTSFEIPRDIPPERSAPFPIGSICPPLRGRVVDPDGADVPRGQEGELVVSGPGVMTGYWNLPERNARAFLVDGEGIAWYHTGDLVIEGEDGVYDFHGRRDRMVKRRGYRIELGEIEAGLARHPAVREVAVVAFSEDGAGVRIRAYLALRGEERPSLIGLKQYCAENLPRYMVPDLFSFVDALPRTSTDKIDYQGLLVAV